MLSKKIVVLFLFAALLAACGGQATATSSTSSSTTSGDAAAGEALFKQATIGNAPGCASCHSTEAGKVLVGPSLAGIATDAATDVEGQTAEEFLRTSILQPDAVIAEGFSAGMMYQDYKTALSDTQVNDLVAYLMTLK